MPGGGIDYSKWDHLDEYSDDEDDDGDNQEPSVPRVTRLDHPSSVTFGGSGGDCKSNNAIEVNATPSVEHVVALSSLAPAGETATTTTTTGSSVNGNSTISSSKPASKTMAETDQDTQENEKWSVKGGVVSTKDSRQLYWTQDRYSVTIRCQLFGDEKPKSVTVDGILPYADRHCAMGTTKPRLKVVDGNNNNNKIVLEGNLPHPVHLANDDDEIDWCIERRRNDDNNDNNKFVAITLYKAVPMQGLFIWWKRPFMEYEEIRIDQEPSQASKEFLQSWEEAHKLFKEKKREPYSI